jgi:tetratricopeptide (TPR) repeat protein
MGVLAVSAGKVKEALPFFQAALEAKPSTAQFWLSYIGALIKLDRIIDAKAVFDQAKENGAKGEVFDQLEQQLADSTVNARNPPSDQLQPIINLYSQGQLQLALSRSTEMLNKFPYSVVLFNIVGASNLGLMKFDAAIEGFKQALKIKPNFAEAFNNMGTALKGKGDLDAAIKSYKQALKIRPEYAGAYSNMSIALTDKGDLWAAINSCKQALRIEPNNAEALNNMGNALKNKGDLESAISSYEQALNIKPDFAEVFNNMGTALDAKGSSEAAINSFNQALKLKPDYAEAHYNLGVVLLGIRQYERAVKYLKFSDFENSKYHLLKCLYLQDKKSSFYDQLDYLIIKGEIHPLIGSLGCRSALKYGIERPNLFCKDPLNYLLKTQLNEQYDFEKIFIKTAKKILNKDRILNKKQGLLTNGYQTSGTFLA